LNEVVSFIFLLISLQFAELHVAIVYMSYYFYVEQYLSSEPEEIVRALRKSSSGILEVNSDGSAVRRSPDNPPPDIFSAEQRQKMKEKTVYVVTRGCGW